MPFVVMVAFGYAIIIILSAFAGFGVLRPKLRIIFRILAWIVTVALIIYIIVNGLQLATYICACGALAVRGAVEFMSGSVVLGKNGRDVLEYYDGKIIGVIFVALMAIVLGLFVYGIISLVELIIPAIA